MVSVKVNVLGVERTNAVGVPAPSSRLVSQSRLAAPSSRFVSRLGAPSSRIVSRLGVPSSRIVSRHGDPSSTYLVSRHQQLPEVITVAEFVPLYQPSMTPPEV